MKKLIRHILKETRVPRSERVELYKDENIIVVVPLTHRSLQKYANQCQWCINSDNSEWEDYHKGKHAVIIQRNPKKPKIGITGQPVPSEIFVLAKWDNNESSFEDVCGMLEYKFRNDRTMSDYYVNITNDINNFATNIVYYSPVTGMYDQENNFLWNFNYEINKIPNVTPQVIKIMDDYLQESEEMNLQETIKIMLREETNPKQDLYYEFRCTDADDDGIFYDTCFGEIDSTDFAQFIDDMENYKISKEEFKDKFTLTKSINKIINNPESEEWLEFYDKSEEDEYVVIFDGDIHYIYSV